jgi:hypothetical protein
MPLQPRFRLGLLLLTDFGGIVRVFQRCPSCDRWFKDGVLNVQTGNGAASISQNSANAHDLSH